MTETALVKWLHQHGWPKSITLSREAFEDYLNLLPRETYKVVAGKLNSMTYQTDEVEELSFCGLGHIVNIKVDFEQSEPITQSRT